MLNFPIDKIYHEEKKENVDFAVILTEKEEVTEADALVTYYKILSQISIPFGIR